MSIFSTVGPALEAAVDDDPDGDTVVLCGTSRERSPTSKGKRGLPRWLNKSVTDIYGTFSVLAPCWGIETTAEPRVEWLSFRTRRASEGDLLEPFAFA